MRILHLSPLNVWSLGYGNGRVSTYRLLKGCVDRGHEVVFVTSARDQKQQDEELEREKIPVCRFSVPVMPINVRYLWNISLKIFWLLFALLGLIRVHRMAKTFQPDLIYAHTPMAAIPAFLMRRIYGVPYVLRLYGTSVLTRTKEAWNAGRILRRLEFVLPVRLKANRYVVTDDGTAGDQVLTSLGVPRERIEFWVNGINKAVAQSATTSFRSQCGDRETRVLLTVSRLVNWKRVDAIIRALPPLVSAFDRKVLLLVVGDGPSKDELKELCKDLGLTSYVRFEGAVPQASVPRYIAASDVFVSMNSLSSISNPVLEAMVMGKTVVALNVGATSTLIKHYETGILCETNALPMLHEHLLTVLINAELRATLGRAAQEYVLRNWPSWEERIDREVDLMEDVATGCKKKRARQPRSRDCSDVGNS